jgi:Fic family protein
MKDETAPEVATSLLETIAAKKQRLDGLRPLSPEALAKLEHHYDVELTYSSNAIEGNTLSAVDLPGPVSRRSLR